MSVSIFYCFFSWTLFFSSSYIISGKLSNVILKPVNPFLFISAQSFEPSELFSFIVGFVIFIYAVIISHISLIDAFFLILLIIPGILMLLGIFLIIASLAKYIPKIDESFTPLMSILNYAQYPTTIYPGFIKFILTWLLPYSLIAFYPVALIMGKASNGIVMFFLPFYGFLLFIIGYLLFNRTVKNYQSTGN